MDQVTYLPPPRNQTKFGRLNFWTALGLLVLVVGAFIAVSIGFSLYRIFH